ncbi:hypothetical protein ACX5K5_16075 [Glutamicibacter bergerei]|jgi:hypothetical protein|uniref:Uncharacterized protein n=2 Tax=Glutamicibacter TaxID=1742989 RepID=A0ABV9MMY5_9MICC|nr:hypothetical protein [Glutamicibacter ardleyensis]GGJ51328.1 hypothetical protein GCM10007173_07360 [Glutamicibacter ardleyensis]
MKESVPTNSTDTSDQTLEDHISDPALSDEAGHDWTDEGGATPAGPATDVSPDGSQR